MGLCKDCKHWEQEYYALVETTNYCGLTESTFGHPKQENALAWAEDYESYGARLRTSPEFGCIQFEAKT